VQKQVRSKVTFDNIIGGGGDRPTEKNGQNLGGTTNKQEVQGKRILIIDEPTPKLETKTGLPFARQYRHAPEEAEV